MSTSLAFQEDARSERACFDGLILSALVYGEFLASFDKDSFADKWPRRPCYALCAAHSSSPTPPKARTKILVYSFLCHNPLPLDYIRICGQTQVR